MMEAVKRFMKDESGQAVSEYGLVLGVVVIAVIATLGTFKDKIVKMFQNIGTALDGTTTTAE